MILTHLPKGFLINTKWADNGFGEMIWVSPENESFVMLYIFGNNE